MCDDDASFGYCISFSYTAFYLLFYGNKNVRAIIISNEKSDPHKRSLQKFEHLRKSPV